MSALEPRGHVVVIGGGITGLVAAYRLLHPTDPSHRPTRVTLVESSSNVGGKIRTSPFAGFSGIDEGPDSYLARVPAAGRLVRELGLGDELTNPTASHAAIMHGRLHPIPDGLMMGVPTGAMSLARSGLLTWRAKIRAGMEPILPSSGDHRDSVGNFVRQRFGRQVHELLVDPLVGGIYAADTNTFSLATVPQLADLAAGRSVLLTARRRRRTNPPSSDPIFETPRAGLSALTETLRARITGAGGTVNVDTSVIRVSRDGSAYRVETSNGSTIDADAIVIASPAATTAPIVAELSDDVARVLATTEHASVVMVTLRATGPDLTRFAGMSGYLVPKPDQNRVTAVSFGSNKWAHWKPHDDSMIMRVSLGRDGARTDDLLHEWSDERLVEQVIDEVRSHTGVVFEPHEHRVTRWEASFPQYRPGHLERITHVESVLERDAPGVRLAGASIRGIGIAACITQAESAATAIRAHIARAEHLRD